MPAFSLVEKVSAVALMSNPVGTHAALSLKPELQKKQAATVTSGDERA